jgi:L,D-peptidoglycan transpeptidase YkuD (ErfK/YbiS/YcfS/YnhG family)
VQHTDGFNCNLQFKGRNIRCSLGKNGVTSDKKEGDGCTPIGSFKLRQSFYRADRIPKPTLPSWFASAETLPDYGWCDDVNSVEYNKFVMLPFAESHENLWLNDSSVYDLLAVIGYNDDPIIPGAGSAIFFHVTESYGSTAGCVAISLADLQWVLENIEPSTYMEIS